MSIVFATATEMQNNFGKYLSYIMKGDEVVITKNGKEVGRLVPKEKVNEFLTDSLIGVLEEVDPEKAKEEYFKEKYDIDD